MNTQAPADADTPKADIKAAMPAIGATESEGAFIDRLRAAGASRAAAGKHARKQYLLRVLNPDISHANLVRVVRRLVQYL